MSGAPAEPPPSLAAEAIPGVTTNAPRMAIVATPFKSNEWPFECCFICIFPLF